MAYVQLSQQSVPADPPSGDDSLYFDEADGHLKSVDSTGTVTDYISGASAAGGDLSGTYPDPEVVATHLSAPLPVDQGGTGAATLTGILKGNGTSAVGVVAAPSGAIVGTTDIQTLTNKTLTSPVISSISNTGTLTLPTATDTLVGRATTDTLSNKRGVKRVLAITSSFATPTWDSDNYDIVNITGLNTAITNMSTNASGTRNTGDQIIFYITDAGSPEAIAWGALFAATVQNPLPTTTVASKRLMVGFLWNEVTSLYDCAAVAQVA